MTSDRTRWTRREGEAGAGAVTEDVEAEEGETGAETGTGRGGETGETETEEGDTDQSGLHPILIFYPPSPRHHTSHSTVV